MRNLYLTSDHSLCIALPYESHHDFLPEVMTCILIHRVTSPSNNDIKFFCFPFLFLGIPNGIFSAGTMDRKSDSTKKQSSKRKTSKKPAPKANLKHIDEDTKSLSDSIEECQIKSDGAMRQVTLG